MKMLRWCFFFYKETVYRIIAHIGMGDPLLNQLSCIILGLGLEISEIRSVCDHGRLSLCLMILKMDMVDQSAPLCRVVIRL